MGAQGDAVVDRGDAFLLRGDLLGQLARLHVHYFAGKPGGPALHGDGHLFHPRDRAQAARDRLAGFEFGALLLLRLGLGLCDDFP